MKYLSAWLICNDFNLLDFSMTWFLLKCVQTWCRHTCPTVLEKVSTFAHSDRLCTNESCSQQTYISNLDNIGFWKWYPFFGSQLEIFLYFKYIRSNTHHGYFRKSWHSRIAFGNIGHRVKTKKLKPFWPNQINQKWERNVSV